MNPSHTYAQRNAASLPAPSPTGRQLFSGLAFGVVGGLVAALFSQLGAGQWYKSLVKPLWAPTEAAFIPIQFFVFVLTGVALAHLWAAHSSARSKNVVVGWFWAQLVLGVAWSFCFFILHSSAWAYVVALLLWGAIVALLWTGSRLSRRAFFLLIPMFLWSTFSSSLTFAVLSFNVLRQETAEMDADPQNQNSPKDPPIIVRKR